MKLKSVIELAAVFLGLNELIDLGIFLFNEPLPEAMSILNSSRELRKLITCANIVIKETAADYAPLRTTETVSCGKEGRILFNTLSRAIYEPVALYGIDGNSIAYDIAPDGLTPKREGAARLEYAYIPESITLFEEVVCDTRITDRVLAYGAAAEYALSSGLHDVVHLWDRRFRDSIQAATSTAKRVRVLPPPKWK